ncbi:uncharacterized protein LOC114855216 [Betta splendens]|uniref:Uncharacterized protein LOC114855216 n=1 Tax=Betta splendens TaxID=158456 RepID=A0A6P7MHQ3_BETSP|nr:uncharacterized protein LOC114855216 [Betta splendens]
MDRLCILCILFLGFNDIGQFQTYEPTLEFTVTPGNNVTLYCDCTRSSGVYIQWYRNCSHGNQPLLVLNTMFPNQGSSVLTIDDSFDFLNPLPRFHLVENQSSNSYDLMIVNITRSDEGLYYCGTVTGSEKYIRSSVTTRIKLCETHNQLNSQDCIKCWTLLYCLCPACAVFSSLLSALLVYHLSRKTVFGFDSDTAKRQHINEERPETRSHTRINEDEDVCYAALDVRQMSQKSRKRTQSSEFGIYSDINTSRM